MKNIIDFNRSPYMKPATHVLKIQQYGIICSSPASMDGQSLGKYSGGDDTVTDDNDIW